MENFALENKEAVKVGSYWETICDTRYQQESVSIDYELFNYTQKAKLLDTSSSFAWIKRGQSELQLPTATSRGDFDSFIIHSKPLWNKFSISISFNTRPTTDEIDFFAFDNLKAKTIRSDISRAMREKGQSGIKSIDILP